MNDPRRGDQPESVAKVFSSHAIEEKDLLENATVKTTTWACHPHWKIHEVRSWCRKNLRGREAPRPWPEYDGWCVALERAPDADPLDMGVESLGIKITTVDPEDHMLVELTWR